ncbi:MAG TPA: hypothetical protein VE197_03980, partial [Mycobacterium sp.]|nr:hypothetical protein [Mycobacterium sp.]
MIAVEAQQPGAGIELAMARAGRSPPEWFYLDDHTAPAFGAEAGGFIGEGSAAVGVRTPAAAARTMYHSVWDKALIGMFSSESIA